MAAEKAVRKRKAAVPADEIAEVKKVKKAAAEILPAKRKAADDASAATTKKNKTPKMEAAESILVKKPKSSKEVKKAKKELEAIKDVADDFASDNNEAKDDITAEEENDSEVEELDDQTEALLKGFESDDSEDEGARDRLANEPIPELDKKTKKKLRKLQEKQAAQEIAEGPGVIYLGRIPHGFYENEMRQYFKQFGAVKNVRLSRNPKTGASKHYAFIEFESGVVADIAAKTMDNYLMFGHILKCKLVPKEQVHDELFKGANRRFKKVPWNKIQGRKLKMGLDETKWDEKVEREQKRRAEKAAKLKASGYIYDFDTPELKTTKDIKREVTQSVLTAANEEESQTPAATEVVEAVVEEDVVAKTSKKQKSKKAKSAPVEVVAILPVEATVALARGPVDEITDTSVKESKKSKKSKRVSAAASDIVVAEIAKDSVTTGKKDKARRLKA